MKNFFRITTPEINWKKISIQSAATAGLIIGGTIAASIYFSHYRWTYQSPIILQAPILINKNEMISPLPEIVGEIRATEPTPAETPPPLQTATKPIGQHQTRVYEMIGEIWGDDADLGRRMAKCESTYGTNVENKTSTARGVFQFLAGTWREQRTHQGDDPSLALRFNEEENIKTAYKHYKRMGTSPWTASEHCWGK